MFGVEVEDASMIHVLGCIAQQHDVSLVLLALAICALACWTAISLYHSARATNGWSRVLWTLTAGCVFGAGIWSTHFIAMLAYKDGVPIGYDLLQTAYSIALAVGISTIGFAAALHRRTAPFAGFLLGLAIAEMHFEGIRAIRGPVFLSWNEYYVGASLIAGTAPVVLAMMANARIEGLPGRIMTSVLLGLGICTLHFTAMSAVTLIPVSQAVAGDVVLAPGILAVAVASVAILIVTLGLIAALADNYLTARKNDEAKRLQAYIVELQAAHRELEETSQELSVALADAAAASTAKSAFLAAMSHELRTPLNAVIGFSEMMMSEVFGKLGDSHYREYAADIHQSGQHLLAIISDVLEFSRLDAGQTGLNEECFALADVMNDTLRMMEPQAAAANVRLSRQFSSPLPHVFADARRIKQIFLNILSNAVKFTPPGGEVSVAIDQLCGGLRVKISDTGIGISEADIPRAFERFGQIDSRLSRKYEGTGLGLPLTKQLVELHGGTLTLESKPNVGTTVTILLPAERTVSDKQAVAA